MLGIQLTLRRPAVARRMILIVDDVADNRQMYAEYLEFEGYRVEQARNGVEALALAPTLRPALIVMDLSMPGMDGWDATRQLKADRGPSRSPSSSCPATRSVLLSEAHVKRAPMRS